MILGVETSIVELAVGGLIDVDDTEEEVVLAFKSANIAPQTKTVNYLVIDGPSGPRAGINALIVIGRHGGESIRWLIAC